MKKWMLKATIQGLLSCLPQSAKWNYLLQRYVTKATVLSAKGIQRHISYCAKHLEYYREHGAGGWPPSSVLELGTGWFPTIPISMYLCGADTIYTVDISRLINRDTLSQTLRSFKEIIQRGGLEVLPAFSEERAEQVVRLADAFDTQSIQETLAQMNINYLVCDARQLPLPDGSVGLFVSNTTLEHIGLEIIQGIFQEFYRVATPQAIMSHLVDLSDHYAHFDATITPLNYLRYNDKQWRLFNNPLHYQSRLHISQYRKLHAQSGFEIIAESNCFAPSETLASIHVSEQFECFEEDDLLGILTWMISRKTDNAPGLQDKHTLAE